MSRALIASNFYPPHVGGIERYSQAVARELRRRGWAVHVVCCTPDASSGVGQHIGTHGERVVSIGASMFGGRLPVPRPGAEGWRQLRLLDRHKFDLVLVQSHLFLSNLIASRFVDRNSPVLWLNHGSGHIPTGSAPADCAVIAYEHGLARVLRRRADIAAGVSLEAARWLEHFGIRTTASVGNGMDVPNFRALSEFNRAPEEPLRVAYVGRLEARKGGEEAARIVLRARQMVPPGTPEPHLSIVGSGSRFDAVRALAEDSDGTVTLVGGLAHDDVRALLERTEVFLYPSQYPEGFPTVMLEAGAAGCGVLAFPVAGARELMPHDDLGWIAGSEEEAARRLAMLAADPRIARGAGMRLRARIAEQYSWERVTQRLLDLIPVRRVFSA